MILSGKALDLLDDAEFCPMLPIQERRNNRESQFSPALDPLQLERAGRLSETFPGDRERQSTAKPEDCR
jgi:hypothetical protein